jgi:acyl-CoA synthetase (NDP forming)
MWWMFTEAGSRAVTSHTASMSGKKTIWDLVLKQTGAFAAPDMRQAANLCLGFSMLPWHPYKGKLIVQEMISGSRPVIVGALIVLSR